MSEVKHTCSCGKPAKYVQIDYVSFDTQSEKQEMRGRSFAELSALPKPDPRTLWKMRCEECGYKDPWYWFVIERIATYPQALDWTIHLAEKPWFAGTVYSWGVLLANLFPEVLDRA